MGRLRSRASDAHEEEKGKLDGPHTQLSERRRHGRYTQDGQLHDVE
jgi:hypothetical protein